MLWNYEANFFCKQHQKVLRLVLRNQSATISGPARKTKLTSSSSTTFGNENKDKMSIIKP